MVVAVEPYRGAMYLKQVLKRGTIPRRIVGEVVGHWAYYPLNYVLGCIVSGHNIGLKLLIDVHDPQPLPIGQLLILPPSIPLGPVRLVDGCSSADAKNIRGVWGICPILHPEFVLLTHSRVVMVPADEIMGTLGHCIEGWILAHKFCGVGVVESYAKIPQLERYALRGGFDEFFVFFHGAMHVSDEAY